eukprot:3758877-Prymnesium_polylepis.1
MGVCRRRTVGRSGAPGRFAHPRPPHVPQELRQQAFVAPCHPMTPLAQRASSAPADNGGRRHATSFGLLHVWRSSLFIAVGQHLLRPPGRDEQPPSLHTSHSGSQHTDARASRKPLAQSPTSFASTSCLSDSSIALRKLDRFSSC